MSIFSVKQIGFEFVFGLTSLFLSQNSNLQTPILNFQFFIFDESIMHKFMVIFAKRHNRIVAFGLGISISVVKNCLWLIAIWIRAFSVCKSQRFSPLVQRYISFFNLSVCYFHHR